MKVELDESVKVTELRGIWQKQSNLVPTIFALGSFLSKLSTRKKLVQQNAQIRSWESLHLMMRMMMTMFVVLPQILLNVVMVISS